MLSLKAKPHGDRSQFNRIFITLKNPQELISVSKLGVRGLGGATLHLPNNTKSRQLSAPQITAQKITSRISLRG